MSAEYLCAAGFVLPLRPVQHGDCLTEPNALDNRFHRALPVQTWSSDMVLHNVVRLRHSSFACGLDDWIRQIRAQAIFFSCCGFALLTDEIFH